MRYLFLFSIALTFLTSSCYYDKFEDFKPKAACDTAGTISFDAKIKPILDSKCNSCHGAPATLGGGIILDNYAAVKNTASTGKLLGALIWDGTASAMPKGSFDKIDECSILQIKKWINTNYQQ